MFDHGDYATYFDDKENEEEECLDDGLDTFAEDVSFNTHIKHGDELLIDMVRSRPYLYDKTVHNYKDTQIKENAWTEIATVLNITGK